MRTYLPHVVVVAVVLATACGGADAPDDGGDASAAAEPSPTTSDATDPISCAPGRVERVIDGDSLEVSLDGRFEEVRLLGMNAPEAGECLGDAARTRVEGLVSGTAVRIESFDAERDEFGRLLAYLWIADGLVNEILVAEGLAVARDQSGHPRADQFEEAGSTARASAVGLWAADACGQASGAEIVISDLVADAPGPDPENPNGEWIELENRGSERVDLSGWTVRDESTRHRYTFANGVVLDPGGMLRLFSGVGDDTANELYWGKIGDSVWSNGGDTAFVLDPNGNTVDSFAY